MGIPESGDRRLRDRDGEKKAEYWMLKLIVLAFLASAVVYWLVSH